MPTIRCDPEAAEERLLAAGIDVGPGNTEHERWRARTDDAVAVAYDDVVVVQGKDPGSLTALVRDPAGKDRATVYFDGASRGNPGPGGIGWVLVSADGIVEEAGERIGRATNNEAEYEALIQALEAARAHGFNRVDVRGDSELIVRQVRGEYDVNAPGLRERRVRSLELLDGFDEWSIEHVPRSVNERADDLANEALDRK